MGDEKLMIISVTVRGINDHIRCYSYVSTSPENLVKVGVAGWSSGMSACFTTRAMNGCLQYRYYFISSCHFRDCRRR